MNPDELLQSILQYGLRQAIDIMFDFEEVRSWYDQKTMRHHFTVRATVGLLVYETTGEFDDSIYYRMGDNYDERHYSALHQLAATCRAALESRIRQILESQVNWEATHANHD